MHINNTYLTNRSVGQSEDLGPVADAAKRSEAPSRSASDASVHETSPELADLLNRVKETPQVRQEVLQRVARRMASGYYSTPEAAEKTAETIQKAGS